VRRRQLVWVVAGLAGSGAGLALAGGCSLLPTQTQPPAVARVGVLDSLGPNDGPLQSWASLVMQLRDLGWVDGSTLKLEFRSTEGRAGRISEMLAELFGLPVDVLVSASTPIIMQAKRASGTIPIVMAGTGDPVGTGLVASLARPGGNVTGVTQFSTQLAPKRLELLTLVRPGLTRIAWLGDPDNPASPPVLNELQAVVSRLGLQLQLVPTYQPDDVESAFLAAAAGHAEALIVATNIPGDKARIPGLAARTGLPTMYPEREYVDAGGLMCYGPSQVGMRRRAAIYVDRILRGAKPADLPVEQPREFDFVVNLRAGRALGITLPPDVAAQVTEWVQ
jgi:putative ABC transport system substrate-binding protein